MSAQPHETHTHIEHYGEHIIVYEQGQASWSAYVEDLPVCFAAGDTFEECSHLIKEGLVIHLTGLLAAATRDGEPR